MTQKEKLYEQVLVAENEYRTLTGKGLVNIEKMKEGYQFSSNAKSYSLAELKTKLSIAQEQIKKAKADKAREAYWATPEGAKRKAELEEEFDQLKKVYEIGCNKYIAKATELLLAKAGKGWIINCTNIHRIMLYLTDEVSGKPIFGHNFEVYLDEDYDFKTNVHKHYIAFNIGTMGSFDPLNDNDRVNLYSTFASIIGDANLMQSLLGLMMEWKGYEDANNESKHKIKKELKNPTI